ncbi:hypothetical protein [Paraburkholderia sp. BCC1885]|uniref:hypothetical protein n=1 Tax=Paraburkholderia sp. BCC1885 TaxID=2562669 RepID=UPI00118444DD|nr:hypothetical protein [Paraburkholderia sp. BCC1885]
MTQPFSFQTRHLVCAIPVLLALLTVTPVVQATCTGSYSNIPVHAPAQVAGVTPVPLASALPAFAQGVGGFTQCSVIGFSATTDPSGAFEGPVPLMNDLYGDGYGLDATFVSYWIYVTGDVAPMVILSLGTDTVLPVQASAGKIFGGSALVNMRLAAGAAGIQVVGALPNSAISVNLYVTGTAYPLPGYVPNNPPSK